MELNIKGRNTEREGKVNEPQSNFRARATTLKFMPKRGQERHLTEVNKSQINSIAITSPGSSARFRREEQRKSSLISIRKPEKIQEVSFDFSRNYKAFSTKQSVNISEIEKKLDLKSKQIRETQFRHLGYSTFMNSNYYIEAVAQWTNDRTMRFEEASRKKELSKDRIKNTPRPREDNFSDEEDFQYTYLTKVGRIRKLHHKLLDLSRHPDYIGADNYMSMRQQEHYSPVLRTPKTSAIEESLRIKSVLARNRIKFSLKEMTGDIYSPKLVLLPKGGERLLAKDY